MKIVTPCGWHSCSIVSTGWDTTRLLLDLHWVSFFRKQKQDTEKAVVPRFYPRVHMVKWQKPVFQWLRTSSAVQYAWISWRSLWLFPVDTLTVWTVLQTAGIRMKRRGSTAVPNADRPSLQDLYWAKTRFWLKWLRNWGRQHSNLLLLLVLEMWSATSVLEEKAKPSSPAWCAWTPTVKFTLNSTIISSKTRNTIWWKQLNGSSRWSVRHMTGL